MIPLEKKYNKNLDTCFFLHANGFPPDAYRTLLSLIENKYASKSMLLRPRVFIGLIPNELGIKHFYLKVPNNFFRIISFPF